jgi:hypothetical protein
MQSHILLGALACALVSCASGGGEESAQRNSCNFENCSLAGRLELQPLEKSGSLITGEGECYDLALAPEVYDNREEWNEKKVVLKGELRMRPTDLEVSWYTVKDRRVEAGGCGSTTVYVTDLEQVR